MSNNTICYSLLKHYIIVTEYLKEQILGQWRIVVLGRLNRYFSSFFHSKLGLVSSMNYCSIFVILGSRCKIFIKVTHSRNTRNSKTFRIKISMQDANERQNQGNFSSHEILSNILGSSVGMVCLKFPSDLDLESSFCNANLQSS